MNLTADSSPDHPPMRDDNHAAIVHPVSETVDLGTAGQLPKTVRLVVGQGTNAGTMAEIRLGFYMIGRHRECQIRPKNPSVSRRHCLVQHHPESVRVFDLESKRGTFINDVRLEPKTWHALNHGDRLRCGKYWFEVAIYSRDSSIELDQLSHDSDEDLSPSDSNIGVISSDDLLEDDGLIDSFELDVDTVLAEATLPRSSVAELQDALIDDVVDDNSAEVASSLAEKSKTKSPTRLPKPKIPKQKIRSYSSSGNWIPLDFSGPDSWKTILAFVVMVTVIGYVGWTVHKIQKGPSIKILRGID